MEIKYIKLIQSFNGKEVEITDFNSSLYLKTIGFNKPTISYYLEISTHWTIRGLYHSWTRKNNNKNELRISAPTKRQVESFLKKRQIMNNLDYNKKPLFDLCLQKFKDNKGKGIVVLPTGVGKTVLGVYLISKFIEDQKQGKRKRTVVLVNNQLLVKQWQKFYIYIFGRL